jgi:hypothetical protein
MDVARVGRGWKALEVDEPGVLLVGTVEQLHHHFVTNVSFVNDYLLNHSDPWDIAKAAGRREVRAQ